MKILIYGGKGFIGSYIFKFLKEKKYDIFFGKSRCENYEEVKEEIRSISPTNVICCIGRSHGKNLYSIEEIEQNLSKNINDNMYSILVLMKLCMEENIHLTNITDGSNFNSENEEEIEEDNEPNMVCTEHAIIKTYTEKIMRLFNKNKYLQIRLKYPITGDFNPKCLISKIISYEKVVNKNTSVSILNDILPIMENLIKSNEIGIYNLVNPGSINLLELKILLKNTVDFTLQVEEFNINLHNKEIGFRSHVNLSTKKILSKYQIPDVNESILKIFNKMIKICTPILSCLCCKEQNKILLNLNYQPLANNFHEKFEICENYPLKLMYCPNCFHCQLSHSIDPTILFKNYKYVSGTSQTGLKFFEDNAKFITDYLKIKGKILDIACNDGSQLNYFKKLGWETYGVDPAENLCPIAKEKGHVIICDFWNNKVASELPKMDVITAQNVFAHTIHIDDFLQNCKSIMHEKTSLFIQTSQKNMILNGEFDTTYHEHISFFNTKSMKILVERNGLYLVNVFERDIHGTSYIFEIKTADKKLPSIQNELSKEKDIGLYSNITYDKFYLNAKRAITNLKFIIEKYKNEYKFIGFGAAAKGQTVICYGNIDLAYIIDENPLKIGLYSPKLNIPIVSLDHYKNDTEKKICIIILAWNFANEIKSKIKAINKDSKIIIIEKFFPELLIC